MVVAHSVVIVNVNTTTPSATARSVMRAWAEMITQAQATGPMNPTIRVTVTACSNGANEDRIPPTLATREKYPTCRSNSESIRPWLAAYPK